MRMIKLIGPILDEILITICDFPFPAHPHPPPPMIQAVPPPQPEPGFWKGNGLAGASLALQLPHLECLPSHSPASLRLAKYSYGYV